jgi:hypothetical protein
MQKLSETSSGKNNKSYKVFHHESNKIGFAFSYFSTIFYTIYKKQPKHFYYWSYQLQGGPRKETCLCNVAPGTVVRRGSGEIPAGVAGVRPGEGGEEV